MPRAIEVKKNRRLPAAAAISVVIGMVAMIVVLFTASLVHAPRANAQSEDQVMAAFLFNFARYVEWPKNAFDGSESHVEICILGADGFGDVVSTTVSGKTVNDRMVNVRAISALGPSGDCHILFIGRDSDSSHAEVVNALRGKSVFAVADSEGFASAGGIANFFRTDSRIRFEINPAAAKKVGLKVSSRLLRLAKVVQ